MHETVEDFLQCRIRVLCLLECQSTMCSCASMKAERGG